MTKTVADNNEYGFEIIEDAMEMLVTIYNTVPPEELNEAVVSFQADRVCMILEMFFEYVGTTEGVDIEGLMRAVGMELSSTVSVIDDEEPKVH